MDSPAGLFRISLYLPFYWSCYYIYFFPSKETNLWQAVKSDIAGVQAACQGCTWSPKAPSPLVLLSPFTVKALRLSALSTGVWIEWN